MIYLQGTNSFTFAVFFQVGNKSKVALFFLIKFGSPVKVCSFAIRYSLCVNLNISEKNGCS